MKVRFYTSSGTFSTQQELHFLPPIGLKIEEAGKVFHVVSIEKLETVPGTSCPTLHVLVKRDILSINLDD